MSNPRDKRRSSNRKGRAFDKAGIMDVEEVIDVRKDSTGSRGRGDGIKMEKDLKLIEASNTIIVGIDLEGDIALFNKGAERALGYRKEKVLGTSWFNYLIDFEKGRDSFEVFQWSIGGGYNNQYENRVRAGSGKQLIISWENTVVFDSDGNLSVILLMGRDMTEMKRLEDTLGRQSGKLTSALEDITLYDDLMLHDINNVNTAISGYLELLSGSSKKKMDEYVGRALTEVRRCSSIIGDVKIMSQTRQDPKLTPMDVGESIRRSVEGLSIDGPTIDVPDLDFSVMADKLLDEAIVRILEFPARMESDGSVSISADRERGRPYKNENLIHLVFRFEGRQIDEKSGEDPFHRLAIRDAPGLLLVKRIVESYDGSVWIEDRKGSESGLEIHLRLSEAHSATT